MEKQELNRILEKFAAGNITPAEQMLFNKWLAAADETAYKDVLDQYQVILQQHFTAEKADPDLLDKIKSRIDIHERKQRFKFLTNNSYLRFIAAAAVLLILSVTLFLNYKPAKPGVGNFPENYAQEVISPGGNKAVLILADGSKITLDDSANGEIAKQSDVIITKIANGQLVYSMNSFKGLHQSSALNTIKTPKGGQYQVNLSDGTKVWLNAASSLRYPPVFTGHERKVILIGEAYFEVAKNHAMPFRVVSGNQLIEVLGTHFNINCYPEEELIKTTLLEGSIKVMANAPSQKETKEVVLKPGQQSQLSPAGDEAIHVLNVGNEATAWKNGYFNFNHEDIRSIMRIISRWYDVEVDYQGTISSDKFGGAISRFKNVSEVLDALQLAGEVHFKIEGRRIIVLP